MPAFKALAVIFESVDVTINGKRYTDKMTPTDKQKALDGIRDAPTLINQLKSDVTLSIQTKISTVPLKYLTKNSHNQLFTATADVERAIKLADPSFKLTWGAYDTYFIVVPGSTGGLPDQSASFSYTGIGIYDPIPLKGAALAFIPSHAGCDAGKYQGQLFVHEWLHGVCQAYKKMSEGYTISGGDVDDKQSLKYIPANGDDDRVYFKDLMNGTVKNKTNPSAIVPSPTPGIKQVLWNKGTITSGVSWHISDADFRNCYNASGGLTKVGYQSNPLHLWYGQKYIYIIDFAGPEGDCAIVQYKNGSTKITNFIPAPFWKKFLALNNVTGVGYPVSDVHSWGKGKIQDYKSLDGLWKIGIMQPDNSSKIYHVRGLIWKAYEATGSSPSNGALSYLGYPKGEEYIFTDSATGKKYHRQDFTGGWCWASTTDMKKYGNDKNFATKK